MKTLRWIPALLLGLAAGFAALALTPPSTLSSADKQALLDLHNDLRSQVASGSVAGQPGAADMEHLLWDDGLAQLATDYASSCIWGHNGGRHDDFVNTYAANGRIDLADWSFLKVGENLFASTRDDPDLALLLGGVGGTGLSWFAEHAAYTFGTLGGTDSCSGVCGHYTQMAWADSRYVGCGFATCPTLVGWSPGRTILVCNYFPAGNVVGFAPYQQSAQACSACPADRDAVCDDSLCAGCDFGDPLACLEVPAPEPTRSLQAFTALLALALLRGPRRRERRLC